MKMKMKSRAAHCCRRLKGTQSAGVAGRLARARQEPGPDVSRFTCDDDDAGLLFVRLI